MVFYGIKVEALCNGIELIWKNPIGNVNRIHRWLALPVQNGAHKIKPVKGIGDVLHLHRFGDDAERIEHQTISIHRKYFSPVVCLKSLLRRRLPLAQKGKQ